PGISNQTPRLKTDTRLLERSAKGYVRSCTLHVASVRATAILGSQAAIGEQLSVHLPIRGPVPRGSPKVRQAGSSELFWQVLRNAIDQKRVQRDKAELGQQSAQPALCPVQIVVMTEPSKVSGRKPGLFSIDLPWVKIEDGRLSLGAVEPGNPPAGPCI